MQPTRIQLPPIQTSMNRGGIMSIFSTVSFNQFLSTLLSSSMIIKAFWACVLVGYLLSYNQNVVQYLSVIPGKLLPPNYFVWTLITHSFIELHLYELVADWFIIFLYSKMLEPLWGTNECVLFYFIITVSVAIATSFFYLFLFAVTFDEHFLFNIKIHGLASLLGGFMVAIKQIMPDTIILDLSFVRIRQDHLPLLMVLFSTLLFIVGLTDRNYAIMLTLGVFFSWIYLRFFQRHKNGNRGDSSSSFVFASFFPSQIQPFVAIIANTVFNILIKLKICKQFPVRYSQNASSSTSNSNSHLTITIPVLNADNSDAERRTLKALKALKAFKEGMKKPDDEETKSLIDTDSFVTSNKAQTTKPETTTSTEIQMDQPKESQIS